MPRYSLMIRTLTLAAVLGCTAQAPALAQPQTSDAAFRTTTLNLSAQGEARATPDIVTLTLGVSTEAATAQAASGQAATRLAAVVDALRRNRIEAKDIQTRQVSLYPRYADRSQTPREIVAFQASTTVSATVRDMARAGAVLDAAVAAGANTVQGVNFGMSEPQAVQREARDAAIRALFADADRVAAIGGQRVVRLVSLSTNAIAAAPPAPPPPPPPGMERRAEELVVTGARIDPGQLTYRGNANGVFEIAPR